MTDETPTPTPTPTVPPETPTVTPIPTSTPGAPAIDEKGPGEKLRDAAVAVLIAGRTESVDVYDYLKAKLGDSTEVPAAGAALFAATHNFIIEGKALGVDLVAYLRNKEQEIADKA